ncbi:glycosyl hydrolase family 88 [Spirochaetia bacterium]|nr:glycosyl hydrolase family 88 [Spirochaetia bacterium]
MTTSSVQWLPEAKERIVNKMAFVREKSKDKIPYTTNKGVHDDRSTEEKIFWWTNGFWSGMMWLMFHATKEARYAEIARSSEEKLDRCFVDFYGLHHDVGFMWLLTAVADFRLTGNPESRKRGLHAANILAGRFNPVGNFIRSWNDNAPFGVNGTGGTIIDCMMNLPLLYWASKETGDPRFSQIARRHADTAMEFFIRPDGSVHHIVEFNSENGTFVKTLGGQGYKDGSSWTRGQSWAIYGFFLSYLHTGEEKYLKAARRVADYFISQIPENNLIPVDFDQPGQPAWEDSTAAAIASCGLVEIANASAVNKTDRDHYLNTAIRLMETLYISRTNWAGDNDCILENCTMAYHANEHHINIIYGDYFFIECIFKLCNNNILLW